MVQEWDMLEQVQSMEASDWALTHQGMDTEPLGCPVVSGSGVLVVNRFESSWHSCIGIVAAQMLNWIRIWGM